MAGDIVVGYLSSAPSVSPNLPPEEEEKVNLRTTIIVAVADAYRATKFDWYAYDISDDPNHNQPRPDTLDLPLPPALSRFFTRLPDHLIPFHDDDDHAPVDLQEPIATRCTDMGRAWAVLGTNDHKQQPDMMLLRICSNFPDVVRMESSFVECISLGRGFGDGAPFQGTEWKKVADFPAHVAHYEDPTCLVLRGKLYCLGGHRTEKRPWAMAYDPNVNKWEPLPDPPHLPSHHPIFTAAIDGDRWGPSILVPWDRLLQIYHVDTRCWELIRFDWDQSFGFPLDGYRGANCSAGVAVVVDSKLYWYLASKQCLVGYDLETGQWFKGHLPMHNHGGYGGNDGLFSGGHSPPSLAHLGRDRVANKFCLSWVSHLPPRPKTEEGCVSRLHCLKVRVVISANASPQTGIYPLEVFTVSCQFYLIDSTKLFHRAMLV